MRVRWSGDRYHLGKAVLICIVYWCGQLPILTRICWTCTFICISILWLQFSFLDGNWRGWRMWMTTWKLVHYYTGCGHHCRWPIKMWWFAIWFLEHEISIVSSQQWYNIANEFLQSERHFFRCQFLWIQFVINLRIPKIFAIDRKMFIEQ